MSGSGSVSKNNEPGQMVLNAVGDFNRALNACIQAEKEYVARVSTYFELYLFDVCELI